MSILQPVLTSKPLGLAFDIDGTLSPIAPTPGEARLYPGVAETLERLKKHAHIAILTGRAVENGAALVNVEGLTYIGTHGAEWSEGLPTNHHVQISNEALAYIKPGQELLDLAEKRLAHLPGVFVERKRLGGSVHYRLSPAPESARQKILDALQEPARVAHFLLSEGKRVVDLKPAIPLNKGKALRSFVRRFSLKGVLFAGDDRTDLDAVLEIARLKQEGVQAVAIVVQAADTLPDLLEHADIVVQGVEGMARLLREIAEQC
jgi:trehalose 6-phosphate phosphatase